MSIDVTTEIFIRRPRRDVAAFACDPANDTTWMKNIKEVEWVSEPPLVVGSQIARVAFFLGKRLAYTYEVLELDPGRKLAMKAVDGPFPMTTDYSWDDAPGGTTMTIRVGGGPGGFFGGMAAPLLSMQMRGELQKDLELIKAHLEG